MKSIPYHQTKLFSGSTKEGITETVLFAPELNFQK